MISSDELRDMPAPQAARMYDELARTVGPIEAQDFEVRWAAAQYEPEDDESWDDDDFHRWWTHGD